MGRQAGAAAREYLQRLEQEAADNLPNAGISDGPSLSASVKQFPNGSLSHCSKSTVLWLSGG